MKGKLSGYCYKLLLTVLLLLSYLGTSSHKTDIEVCLLDVSNNVKNLITEKLYLSDLSRIDSLIYPIIYNEVKDNKFSMNIDDLVSVFEILAISESSLVTEHGSMPFKNSLFLVENNPFGIKGGNNSYATFEYYNGVKTYINDSFMSFDSFSSSIRYLLHMFETKERYKGLLKCSSGIDFFNSLRGTGYYTSPDWCRNFFIPYYVKLKRDGNHQFRKTIRQKTIILS